MSPKKAPYIVGTVLVAALGALGLILFQPGRSSLPPDAGREDWSAAPHAVSATHPRPNAAGETLSVVPSADADSGEAKGSARVESEAPPFSEHWFVDTKIDADLRLSAPSPVATVIRWDSACSGHPLREHNELGALARMAFAVDPALILQGNLLPSSHTVFWREGAMFRQIAVNWELDDPATYRVDAYESAEPTLTQAVTRLSEPSPAPRNLVVHADTLRNLYGQPGGNRRSGARLVTYLVQASVSSEQPGPGRDYEVSLLNQQVTAVHGRDLSCASGRGFLTAVCSCPLEESGPNRPQSGGRP